MIKHLLLPVDVDDLGSIQVIPQYKDWLLNWLYKIEEEMEQGKVASSKCLQGVISEILIYGKCKTDWLGVMDEYLVNEEGEPLAYSEEYGKQLFLFSNQWRQTPIHAIHTRWWIENLFESSSNVKLKCKDLIKENILPNGWIYNLNVSPTSEDRRMKSELFMSMIMGLEILEDYDLISSHLKPFQSCLSAAPFTTYMSAEYFRVRALKIINSIELIPSNLGRLHELCKSGKGYCDFDLNSKVDDYMGTKKRVSRDETIHSPLISLFAKYVAEFFEENIKNEVSYRVNGFTKHLALNPFDIPAFKMRDIEFPFGTDITPLEIASASVLLNEK